VTSIKRDLLGPIKEAVDIWELGDEELQVGILESASIEDVRGDDDLPNERNRLSARPFAGASGEESSRGLT
jgi:hypothetical protein